VMIVSIVGATTGGGFCSSIVYFNRIRSSISYLQHRIDCDYLVFMLCNEVTKDQVLVSFARRVPMKIWSENLLLTSPVQEVLVPTVKTEVTVRV
jgi:hypothetical protein